MSGIEKRLDRLTAQVERIASRMATRDDLEALGARVARPRAIGA